MADEDTVTLMEEPAAAVLYTSKFGNSLPARSAGAPVAETPEPQLEYEAVHWITVIDPKLTESHPDSEHSEYEVELP